jgi:S1-C subfamily serine protease
MSVTDGREPDDEALDTYSRVVTTVAERLTPSVASLRVIQRDGRGRHLQGAGSGVVISSDGFVITSAHVVVGTTGGSPPSSMATRRGSRWWDAIRSRT